MPFPGPPGVTFLIQTQFKSKAHWPTSNKKGNSRIQQLFCIVRKITLVGYWKIFWKKIFMFIQLWKPCPKGHTYQVSFGPEFTTGQTGYDPWGEDMITYSLLLFSSHVVQCSTWHVRNAIFGTFKTRQVLFIRHVLYHENIDNYNLYKYIWDKMSLINVLNLMWTLSRITEFISSCFFFLLPMFTWKKISYN